MEKNNNEPTLKTFAPLILTMQWISNKNDLCSHAQSIYFSFQKNFYNGIKLKSCFWRTGTRPNLHKIKIQLHIRCHL